MREMLVIFGLGLVVVGETAFLCYQRWRRRRYYREMVRMLRELDKKYLLSEVLREPDFAEGKMVYGVLQETDKTLAEEVGSLERSMREFRDYIEMWVHEVKTPLTGLGLSMRKGEREERVYLAEIEGCIDQALYYSKVGTVDKDYVVRQVDLGEVVRTVLQKHKDILILNKVRVETEGLGLEVRSDPKWLEFVVGQLVLNSVKYRRSKGARIQVAGVCEEGRVVLRVWDNGVGIRESELKRVTERGFTGSNGRRGRVSTGMGLYIVSRLLEDLGHGLEIDSVDGEWTEARISFGRDGYLDTLR